MNHWQETFKVATNTNWDDNKTKYRYWLETQLDNLIDMVVASDDIVQLQKILQKGVKAAQEVKTSGHLQLIDGKMRSRDKTPA